MLARTVRNFFRFPRDVYSKICRIPFFHKYKSYQNVSPHLVISPGGVATTFLLDYLQNYIEVNDPGDSDALKHIPNIPNSFDPSTKIIYISGNAEDIYNSLKHRGWLKTQGSKLGNPLCYLFHGQLLKNSFVKCVERQIKHFQKQKEFNVLVLDYDEIWTRIEELRDFLNIREQSFTNDFPIKKSRTSKDKV